MSKIKELFCVSDEDVAEVRSMYDKTEDDVEEDLRILLDWLNKQPHLPKPHDKIRLERFLLSNKFRIEQAKVKLDNYYSFKVLYPDFYTRLDIESPEIETSLKSTIYAPMPKLTPNLKRIVYWEAEKNQEDNFIFSHLVQFGIMIRELQLTHDYSTGEIFVCNMKHFTLTHMTKMDVNKVHKSITLFQEGFSGRVSNIDYVNLSPTFDLFLNLLKRVLSAKIIGKIRTHKDHESLHEVIPKECLPQEVGGDLKSARVIKEDWIKEVILQKDFFKANSERTSNEALRVGKVVRNDLFGVDGTFKKINLD